MALELLIVKMADFMTGQQFLFNAMLTINSVELKRLCVPKENGVRKSFPCAYHKVCGQVTFFLKPLELIVDYNY